LAIGLPIVISSSAALIIFIAHPTVISVGPYSLKTSISELRFFNVSTCCFFSSSPPTIAPLILVDKVAK